MTHTDTLPWFELLTGSVANYVDDITSEVYAMRANADHFVRVVEDDNTVILYLQTDNTADLNCGQARLTNMPATVIAATIEAMLG